jgi:hypothetical protein
MKLFGLETHPHEDNVSEHRNLRFEGLAIVALALVTMLSAYSIVASGQSVAQQSANASVAYVQ